MKEKGDRLTNMKTKNTVLVLNAKSLGRGDDQLGDTLIASFLRTLALRDDVPDTIVGYNAGVQLAIKESPAADLLLALEQRGAEILLCGTCVDYFHIGSEIALGTISDMRTIVDRIDVKAILFSREQNNAPINQLRGCQ
jgi:selenium metabolism protein YedF